MFPFSPTRQSCWGLSKNSTEGFCHSCCSEGFCHSCWGLGFWREYKGHLFPYLNDLGWVGFWRDPKPYREYKDCLFPYLNDLSHTPPPAPPRVRLPASRATHCTTLCRRSPPLCAAGEMTLPLLHPHASARQPPAQRTTPRSVAGLRRRSAPHTTRLLQRHTHPLLPPIHA